MAPNGCSTWQTDTDGDGVNDANDVCANTNPLHVSDSKGCSPEQNELIEPSSSRGFLDNTTLVGATGVLVVLLIALLFFRRKESVETSEESGSLTQRRAKQNIVWLKKLISTELEARILASEEVKQSYPELEAQVAAGELTPFSAASQILGMVFK